MRLDRGPFDRAVPQGLAKRRQAHVEHIGVVGRVQPGNAIPADGKSHGFKRPDPFIPDSPGQQQEWVKACKTDKETSCNFTYSGWLTEANHLGNVAYRAGQKLVWDSAKLRATNTRSADPFIRREYRKGWKLS